MYQDPQQQGTSGNIPGTAQPDSFPQQPQGYPAQPGGYLPPPMGYPPQAPTGYRMQPGYPPQFQQSKKRDLLLIAGGFISGLVLAFCIAAVISAATGGKGTTTTSNTPGGSSTNVPTSSQHFKVGDQVKIGDTYVVTVNAVTTSSGDEVFQPKAGNTFLIVDVTVKNTSSKEQILSSFLQFTLKDSTGQKYTETFTPKGTPPDGKIAAGDLVKGQIAYEVPAAQHTFTLAFEADILSSGQTIWDLNV